MGFYTHFVETTLLHIKYNRMVWARSSPYLFIDRATDTQIVKKIQCNILNSFLTLLKIFQTKLLNYCYHKRKHFLFS